MSNQVLWQKRFSVLMSSVGFMGVLFLTTPKETSAASKVKQAPKKVSVTPTSKKALKKNSATTKKTKKTSKKFVMTAKARLCLVNQVTAFLKLLKVKKTLKGARVFYHARQKIVKQCPGIHPLIKSILVSAHKIGPRRPEDPPWKRPKHTIPRYPSLWNQACPALKLKVLRVAINKRSINGLRVLLYQKCQLKKHKLMSSKALHRYSVDDLLLGIVLFGWLQKQGFSIKNTKIYIKASFFTR